MMVVQDHGALLSCGGGSPSASARTSVNKKSLPATEARRGLDGYSPRQEGHGQMVRPSACVSKAGMAGLPYPGCMAKILAPCEMKLQEISCSASMRATGGSVQYLGCSRSVLTLELNLSTSNLRML